MPPIIGDRFPLCPLCRQHYVGATCPKCGLKPVARAPQTPASTPEPHAALNPYPEPPDAHTGPERELHTAFITDMERRGCHCIHSRTDERSTIGTGYPDIHVMFTADDGITRACAVEFKKAGGKPSPAQLEVLADMKRKRIPVTVAWTLKDAILFAREHLKC